jgi:hypothetical protein
MANRQLRDQSSRRPGLPRLIRLHPSNAATLFALVNREGTGATTIVVSGGGAGARHKRAHREDE